MRRERDRKNIKYQRHYKRQISPQRDPGIVLAAYAVKICHRACIVSPPGFASIFFYKPPRRDTGLDTSISRAQQNAECCELDGMTLLPRLSSLVAL